MANTVDTGLLPRTYFKAPRVPFDFRALALGMLGYLVYWGGNLLLNEIFDKVSIVGSFLAAADSIFREIPFVGGVIRGFMDRVFAFGDLTEVIAHPDDYTFWHQLVGGVWIFAVWSFFGQAIHRITSLRIARDEGLSFGEAFAFSAKNWITVILAPLIITLTIAFFYGCNALAGVVISIPFVGQILGLILVPLALISSLLILLIAIGGVLGLPLIGAAAAWERNGSLDAISRAFSYIFARPLQFFWNYFLVFLFVGVILLVGSWFVFVLTKSVDAGVWSDRLSVLIDAPEDKEHEGSEKSTLSREAKDDYGEYRAKTKYTPSGQAPSMDARHFGVEPFALDIQAVGIAPWGHKLSALVFWVILNLIWLGIYGYAIYWFLGATTSVYADLRADVDGTEEDEIYLEEEEEDFDALAEAAVEAEKAVASAGETEAPASEAPASEAPASEAPASEAGDTPEAKEDGEKPSDETEKPDSD